MALSVFVALTLTPALCAHAAQGARRSGRRAPSAPVCWAQRLLPLVQPQFRCRRPTATRARWPSAWRAGMMLIFAARLAGRVVADGPLPTSFLPEKTRALSGQRQPARRRRRAPAGSAGPGARISRPSSRGDQLQPGLGPGGDQSSARIASSPGHRPLKSSRPRHCPQGHQDLAASAMRASSCRRRRRVRGLGPARATTSCSRTSTAWATKRCWRRKASFLQGAQAPC
jgi:hypothetical protein